MSYWQEKVVMVTGASSGIGRGVAVELSRRGAKLGLVARRTETLQEIVSEFESRGGKALAVPGDVQDALAVRAAADRFREQLGPIDVLIANAGIGSTNDSAELRASEVAGVINVNVIGAANSVAAVVPEMVARGRGQLVVISSLAAYRGLPKSAAYCASKAAVSAFFESLRLDLQPRGIAVTIIHPGFIKTPLTAGRHAQMPFLMELDVAVEKILRAIEKKKKSYAFPWQLASIVRAGMIMPTSMYDWISRRNSFRE
ncbi:MAG: SDR family NAD(P)-dependent oxidoreductase [Pyrinomonadaceae bacterium]|nr:SDR family NAD(P)-dependent oxidoreductase [Pyrinomonadaceae bacterium]MDQ3173237.1 SDR family NAD(P)-dependent oxidoreductase [Acidobacteriota bacterium]